jgi:hypothetical protein
MPATAYSSSTNLRNAKILKFDVYFDFYEIRGKQNKKHRISYTGGCALSNVSSHNLDAKKVCNFVVQCIIETVQCSSFRRLATWGVGSISLRIFYSHIMVWAIGKLMPYILFCFRKKSVSNCINRSGRKWRRDGLFKRPFLRSGK